MNDTRERIDRMWFEGCSGENVKGIENEMRLRREVVMMEIR